MGNLGGQLISFGGTSALASSTSGMWPSLARCPAIVLYFYKFPI